MAEIEKPVSSNLTPGERFRKIMRGPLVEGPGVMDELLEPVRKGIHKFVDEKVKPTLLRPGDVSGKKYLYIDPRLDKKDFP